MMKIGKLTIRNWHSYGWSFLNLEPRFIKRPYGGHFIISCFEFVWGNDAFCKVYENAKGKRLSTELS